MKGRRKMGYEMVTEHFTTSRVESIQASGKITECTEKERCSTTIS